MEQKTLEKTLDVAGSVAKIAANLSETKDKTPTYKTDDNSNKASTGTQNVMVAVDKTKQPKPVEKHIHTFPENRPLTSEECELDLKKAQMEYNLKKSEQEHIIRVDDREWQHRMEMERKNERKAKIRRVIGGLLVAIGVGTVGYSIYTDYRDHKNTTVVPPKVPENDPINVEGSVK